jgi:hypothetical protein
MSALACWERCSTILADGLKNGYLGLPGRAFHLLGSAIRQELLGAVLKHTTGAVPSDTMPHKLTVSADRDQLYGAEIIIRLAHHSINEAGDQSSFYGEQPGVTVLAKLEHFCRNRLPGPLFANYAHTETLQQVLYEFLLLSEPAELSFQRWVPSSSSPPKRHWRLTPAQDWEQDWNQAQAAAHSLSACPEEALARLLSAPHLAPSPLHYETALGKVATVPLELRHHLTRALDWAHQFRISEDNRQVFALSQIRNEYQDDLFVVDVTEGLLKAWSAAAGSA